ncbi:MAG TPA: methionine/alanine import family NSS transporter small subunit [Nocardioidaceae bacterium]|nr:methionine/alanine import family NSS transporter small subunit [Nocardioidaceae bacterium]
MSGDAIAMMVAAMVIIWGGLAASLISLTIADRRERNGS